MSVFAGTFGVGAGEVGVHTEDVVELPVAADVVVVSVRVDDGDGELGEFGGNFLQVADAHAGVQEQRFFFAEDEVGDGFFGLVRLVDGVDVRRGDVDFKPGVGDGNALQRFVFGARERLAPVGNQRLLLRGYRHSAHRR